MVNNTLLVYSCEFYLYIVTEPGICEEGTVRLMDGVIQQEGRVEVLMPSSLWLLEETPAAFTPL